MSSDPIFVLVLLCILVLICKLPLEKHLKFYGDWQRTKAFNGIDLGTDITLVYTWERKSELNPQLQFPAFQLTTNKRASLKPGYHMRYGKV